MEAGSATATDAGHATHERRWREAIGSFLAIREGRIGAILLGLSLALVLLGPLAAPYSPTETRVGAPLSGPTSSHLLGTDPLGRDVLSRVLHGGRSVLIVPAAGIMLAFLLAAVVGMFAGYRGGGFDLVSARALDVLLALPPLLVVLVILAAAGGGTLVIILSVALVYMPKIARVLRGVTQNLRTQDFVTAAEARGERAAWILGRELLPNMIAPLSVELAIRLTFAIIFVATLNFLGLGAQPPSPNWGLMVSEGRAVIVQAPLVALAPAGAIAMVVISIHLIADAVVSRVGRADLSEETR